MITVEFERAYMPADADVDLRFGDWTYTDIGELEEHIRDLRDSYERGIEVRRNRSGTVTLIRFL
jgi:hypothetical protein